MALRLATPGHRAAFLACVRRKLLGDDVYPGPVLTHNRLERIMSIASLDDSKHVQQLARNLVTQCIDKGAFTEPDRHQALRHLQASNNPSDPASAKWRWHTLCELCEPQLDSFKGSMIGQCVGDALGFIVEGHGPKKCHEFVSKFVLPKTTPTWSRTHELSFGQYSDDSQLARETYVAVSQANGRVDPVVYGLRIALLFQPGQYRIVGYGRTTANAGEALWMGKHHSTTGTTETSGNGSAMRSAPLGLILSQHPMSTTRDVASTFSCITHAAKGCIDGSVAVAAAARIAMATRSIPFDVHNFLETIAPLVSEDYRRQLLHIEALLQGSDKEAAEHLVQYGLSQGESEWDGVSVGVQQSSLWAIYCFCKHPDDYVKCIGASIACGGDVDTTAAMAGGISGARVGYEAIPQVWRSEVHDLDIWKLEELNELVEGVFQLVKDKRITVV